MTAQNESLAPYYEINEKFFDQKVKELVLRYNYTLNRYGVQEAIKYMYTYWPNPQNTTFIREQYIHVSSSVRLQPTQYTHTPTNHEHAQ